MQRRLHPRTDEGGDRGELQGFQPRQERESFEQIVGATVHEHVERERDEVRGGDEYRRREREPKVRQHEMAKARRSERVGECEARGRVALLPELDGQMFQRGERPVQERRDEFPQVRLVDEQVDAADAIAALGQEREP